MPTESAQIVFPASARAMHERFGSGAAYARRDATGFRQEVTPDLAAFLAGLNSFYLATATRDGRPYIQHRGGPKGFLRPLGPTTLGFADFSGNRQYITLGNLSENPAVHLFLMDYAHRTRIKIWGRARVVEEDPALLARLSDPAYPVRIERAIVIEIDAWDPNCRQHIPMKLDADDVAAEIDRLTARVAELETEDASLLKRTEAAGGA
ncbi:MAG TPA: pyridoxamine 5'-phosphate oxidase family protein [Acidisphaera sp.]|nr:pyridoxamine 5'-phosphate oxidase family protein [Acidisphaera sp.]